MILGLKQRARQLFRRKFVRDVFGVSAARGINLSIGIVSTLMYGILFSKSQIAVVSLMEMVSSLLLAFGVSWSSVGLIRFGKEELLENSGLTYTSSTRLYVVLPILATTIVVLFGFRTSVLDYVGVTDAAFFWYLIGGLLLMAAHDHITTIFTAREKHMANARFYITQGGGRLLILGVFASNFWEPSALRFIAALVWLNFLLLLLRLPGCGKSFIVPLRRVRAEDMRRFLRYTAPQLYGFAGIYVINWIDIYFIRKYGTMDSLGAYQFMYTIFVKLSSFAMLANTLLFPRIMAWKHDQMMTKVSQFTRRAPVWVFLFTTIACGVLLMVYRPIFGLFFGDKYTMAYTSFDLLICSLPFFFLGYIFVPVLNSFDRVKYVQTANIISAACNFLIDFALVAHYGIIGAAMGTFVAFAVRALILMLPVHRMFGVRYMALSLLSVAIAAVTAFLFVHAIWL